MTERLSHKRDCLYKNKITCSKSHLFVLKKADYTYKNTVVSVCMYKKDEKAKYSQKFDGKIIDSIEIYSEAIQTKIWEVDDSSEKSYISEFEYNNAYYTVWGSMPENEFKKIIAEAIF